jgi:hypothetical protein
MAKKRKISAVDVERAVRLVVMALRNARIPYMLVGALALPAWGRPRATLDIDFMILADTIPERLTARLAAFGFERDVAWERYNPFLKGIHARFRSANIVLDILVRKDAHHDAAFGCRRKKYHQGIYIWFPAPEDLILLKLRAGRPTLKMSQEFWSVSVKSWISRILAGGPGASELLTN